MIMIPAKKVAFTPDQAAKDHFGVPFVCRQGDPSQPYKKRKTGSENARSCAELEPNSACAEEVLVFYDKESRRRNVYNSQQLVHQAEEAQISQKFLQLYEVLEKRLGVTSKQVLLQLLLQSHGSVQKVVELLASP